MSGNARRSPAKPFRNRVTSSAGAQFWQIPTKIICFGTPALLTDSRTNIHPDGMGTLTWNSCGRSYTSGVGSDHPAALPSPAWLPVSTAEPGSFPRPTALMFLGGLFQRSALGSRQIFRLRYLVLSPVLNSAPSGLPYRH